MIIVRSAWKRKNLCRSQHSTFFSGVGDKSRFPVELACHRAEAKLFALELTGRCPAFPGQGVSSHAPAACLLGAGWALYPPGWDDDAPALLLPGLANGLFLFSRSHRQSPEAALVRLSVTATQPLVGPCVWPARHPTGHALTCRRRGEGKKSNSQPL